MNELHLGELEAPLGASATPRPWKACNASFPMPHTKERRVPIISYGLDQKTGMQKAFTVAYAVGPNPAVAHYRAKRIQDAINKDGGAL